jgi:hypothetical protein
MVNQESRKGCPNLAACTKLPAFPLQLDSQGVEVQ